MIIQELATSRNAVIKFIVKRAYAQPASVESRGSLPGVQAKGQMTDATLGAVADEAVGHDKLEPFLGEL